jgi:hypothetical protein
MGNVTKRPLVLAFCVLLALPPGWCCVLPVCTARGTERAPSEERHDCCKHCPHREDRAKPPVPMAPAPEPCALCCQPSLDRLPPASPEKVQPDLSLPTPLLPMPVLIAEVSGVVADVSLPDPSPPLNVLHCVWLC